MGMGEQVLVCGEAPFLGGGDPEKALPLFTTPADYPLWFTRVGTYFSYVLMYIPYTFAAVEHTLTLSRTVSTCSFFISCVRVD